MRRSGTRGLRERVVRQLEGSREAVAALAAGVMQRIARAYLHVRQRAQSDDWWQLRVVRGGGPAATRVPDGVRDERARARCFAHEVGGWAEGEGAALQADTATGERNSAEREAAASEPLRWRGRGGGACQGEGGGRRLQRRRQPG